jgi:hypothetical protein
MARRVNQSEHRYSPAHSSRWIDIRLDMVCCMGMTTCLQGETHYDKQHPQNQRTG